MADRQLKVGELALKTGLTVRTLHHYDQIGLLRPSVRTVAGHRLYGTGDVRRLQQICSLRLLGLSLEQICESLDRPDTSALSVLELHLQRIREQLRQQQKLLEQLETLADRLRQTEEVSVEEITRAIEAMTMFEKYYTPEQIEQLAERRRQLGEEHIKGVEAEWPQLMEQVREEMERGTPASDARVRQLAQRWQELVAEFTGGDPGIIRSLGNLYREERSVAGMDTGPIVEMGSYLFGSQTR